MVGSGGGGGGGGAEDHHHHHQHHQQHQQHQHQHQQRNKEAVGMVALHEALRTVCLNPDWDWTYSVFWSIRPRPRVRGGNGCKVGDDNGSLMLMWEDGYCRGRGGGDCYGHDMDGEDPVRKAFSKMSIQLYNYGEGLMGKVASDKCHKWVFKEQTESESNVASYWQSSFDAIPPEWNDQFESGIQTIAVIQAGHGLLQLGSCKIIPEDLHFVLRMRHTFESLGYQSGFYLSQLFSSNRTTSPSHSSLIGSNHPIIPPPTQLPPPPLPAVFNWVGQRPIIQPQVPIPIPTLPGFQPHIGLPRPTKEQETDVKWPNGLSFFNALTDNVNAKLLFGVESLGDKPDHHQDQNQHQNQNSTENEANPSEFLSLDSHRNMTFLE